MFYVNSIVWWQLLGKEAIDWQGTWVSAQPSTPSYGATVMRWPRRELVLGRGGQVCQELRWDRVTSVPRTVAEEIFPRDRRKARSGKDLGLV